MADDREQLPSGPAIRELPDPSGALHRLCEFTCPRTGRECFVPVKDSAIPNGWDFDGNVKAPTLSPSIRCYDCGWHGYVRAGMLVDA